MTERAETLTTALYSALDPSKREIRLLHRSKDNDNNYRLSVFSFDNAPPFFALSYVWGSSDDRRHVVVEGVSVPSRRTWPPPSPRFGARLTASTSGLMLSASTSLTRPKRITKCP